MIRREFIRSIRLFVRVQHIGGGIVNAISHTVAILVTTGRLEFGIQGQPASVTSECHIHCSRYLGAVPPIQHIVFFPTLSRGCRKSLKDD